MALAKPILRAVKTWRKGLKLQHIGTNYLRMYVDGLQRETANLENTDPRGETFSEIFKRSQFATVLDPIKQKVEGKVLAVVEDKMYVDFGCKFHAVVPVPKARPESYDKGTRVVVRVLDLEMTNHFIGDHRDLSLLEAQAELVEE